MIELWGRPNAYNVQKALWILRELELEFTHYDVGSKPGELDTAEFRSLNPHGRIPVIRDAGAVVWESNSILRYLAARYDPGKLWQPDPLLRSHAERWMDWELDKLQPDFIDLFWGYYRTPPESRKQQAIDAARRKCEQHFALLDRHLAVQPYVAGESFSMGDIPCAVCLYRYFEMGLEVEKPPHVMHWYERLARREAYRGTIMTPFDELKGRTHF